MEKNSRRGGEKVAGSTSPLIKGKRGRERVTTTVTSCPSSKPSKTVCLLPTAAYRYVNRRDKRSGSDVAMTVQRPSAEHILHRLQSDKQRPARTRQRQHRRLSGNHIPQIPRDGRHQDTRGEPCRSIVGYDANALYLWAMMQEMPTCWYTRRRAEKQFRPQPAQPYGQISVQWLTWEAAKNGCTIRHQVNGREKRIGKLPVDGWCPESHTAYQFHGCYFHGCPKCYDHEETNTLNGKTMVTLLENTRRNTAYLKPGVHTKDLSRS